MKRSVDKRKTIKPKAAIRSDLDIHKWATKMEIRRLLSGKADLKIEEDSKPSD